MLLHREPPDWNSDHAKLLRDFLESEAGQLALAWVSHNAPTLLDGSDVHKTLVASGEVKGYGRALAELVSLTYEKPKVEQEPTPNFPDLDDDAQWVDVPRPILPK